MEPRPSRSSLPLLAAALLLAAACAGAGSRAREVVEISPPLDPLAGTAYAAALELKLPEVEPQEVAGLHNLYRLSEAVVSGGEPHDEDSFRHLREMGVRTILSVDGKAPDAELAAKYGMTYVHVPIQYKGIRADELLEIAKTFREKEGPFYVHCFHGKHRGPAAAAIGRLVVDGVSRREALAEMRQWCGTSESYEGLYQAIATGDLPSVAETAAYDWDFPSAHTVEGLRPGMIEVSRIEENLRYLSRNGWHPGEEHPDADPLREATRLEAALAQCRAVDGMARPDDFRSWMEDAIRSAGELREVLAAIDRMEGRAADADEAYKRVRSACKACHAVYRDE